MNSGYIRLGSFEKINRRDERHESMIGKISGSCIELINSLLLIFGVDFFDFKLGHRVNFLDVEIGWHPKLMLLVVLLSFLDIKGTIHDLYVNFKTRRLLFEIG